MFKIKISYLQQKELILKAVSSDGYFSKLGHIWQTLETGVNYPVLHYLPLNDFNDCNDIEMNAKLGKEFTSSQVLYEEIESIEIPVIVSNVHTNGTKSHSNGTALTGGPNCAQIFVGFKTVDKTFNTLLEENWKDWTGARNLYLNLSSDFGLLKICLMRGIDVNNLDAFMYILIAYCTHINDKNRILLLDFVDRFRLQRLSCYLTVYTNVLNDNI
ncbi:unnamed protein product [Medioppia subpectinata]|uniref:DUF7153 domain-containing protein n=1 Tax=Medioppia subpectinata TaxID=1979941 RepID=A0A7R9PT49_9ACAR|nr:unnamed protein product [Medioppia subpectinata]CAG2100290.1 unnamed protein product [Medioppia subpectinata]